MHACMYIYKFTHIHEIQRTYGEIDVARWQGWGRKDMEEQKSSSRSIIRHHKSTTTTLLHNSSSSMRRINKKDNIMWPSTEPLNTLPFLLHNNMIIMLFQVYIIIIIIIIIIIYIIRMVTLIFMCIMYKLVSNWSHMSTCSCCIVKRLHAPCSYLYYHNFVYEVQLTKRKEMWSMYTP